MGGLLETQQALVSVTDQTGEVATVLRRVVEPTLSITAAYVSRRAG